MMKIMIIIIVIIVIIVIIQNNKTVQKQKITRTIHSVESSEYSTKIYTNTPQSRQKINIFIASIISKSD